jgi:hypothetical protein
MKKAVMLFAVMLIAGLSQAASVTWNSGGLQKPTGLGSGVFNGATGATAGIYFATVFIYTDAGGTSQVTGLTGDTDSSTSPGSVLNGTAGTSLAANTTYYAQVLITTTEGGYTYSLESSLVSFVMPGTGNGSVNFSAALPTVWTVVPEPTSMALLALGVAALGLRRKFRK